jgi:hypothetical protein
MGMNVILIGGVADNRIIEDPEYLHWEVREPLPDFCAYTNLEPMPMPMPELKETAYRRESLIVGKTEFVICVDDKISTAQAVWRLPAYYKPTP